MKLGIDVDGVVADLVPRWVELYNEDFGDSLDYRDITEWDVFPFMKKAPSRNSVYKLLQDERLYAGTRVVKGAYGGVAELCAMGHEVYYVTSCPGWQAGEKAKWLEEHGFLGFGDMVALTSGHGRVPDKSIIGVDLLLDDHGENLRNMRGRKCVLFDTPYNRFRYPEFPRVGSWQEFVALMQDRG